ncbi:MAG: hypothetical protein ACAH17_00475 [Candidatus Paceibacterota bacterium]
MYIVGSTFVNRVFTKVKKLFTSTTNSFFETQRSSKNEHTANLARRYTMKKFMNSRAFGALATLVVAFALAACGGGDPETVPASSWSKAPVAVEQSTQAAKQFAAKGALATQSQDMWGGGDAFTVTNELFDRVAEVSYTQYFPDHRGTGTYQQYWYRYYPATGCYVGVDMNTAGIYVMGCDFGPSPVYVGQLTQYYTPVANNQVVFANADSAGWYPFRLTLTSGATSGTVAVLAEKAINSTSFQTGVWPLFNCEHNTVRLSRGRGKLNCVAVTDHQRHDLVWDPATNEITEYDGSEGPYPNISDSTWIAAQTDTPPVNGWGMFAEISAGWIYNMSNPAELHFKRKSDGKDTVLSVNIGLVKAMATFTK